jgi:tetratricopeptide (TPR) repeat protein
VREHLERSLEISPEYVFARLRLGELEGQHGDVEIGLAMIEETARRYPEWAEAAYSLGRMLVGQGRHAEAADAHARAAAIEPQTLRYHYAAARNHQLAGDVEASLPYLESCERIQSGYEDVAFLLGYALQTTGRRDEAVECYRRHLAVDPDHLQTNYNLGYALMQAERPADAIPFFRRTLELQEGYLSAERYLAECERGAGVETPRD